MNDLLKIDVSKRLKMLRTNRGLSQPVLAAKIAYVISSPINLDGDNGKAIVSQLERGSRGLTIELACAYADVFDVSLDFIYGRVHHEKSEYKNTAEQTKLSDEAIRLVSNVLSVSALKEYYQLIVSKILENKSFWSTVYNIYDYSKQKAIFSKHGTIEDFISEYTNASIETRKYMVSPDNLLDVLRIRCVEEFAIVINDVVNALAQGGAISG